MTDEPAGRPGEGGFEAADGRGERTAAPRPSAVGAADPGEGLSGPGPAKPEPTPGQRAFHFVRETVIIVVIALLASALLRAFVVQAFYVPSGSMLPEIQLQDRILVSRIGDIDRGEVVVFEDPGNWIPPSEAAQPPGTIRRALEWIGVLPASGHEHLVKRVVGLPGDHVVCCNRGGRLTINGQAVDESDFLFQEGRRADNVSFDVVVPADHIFVLGDHRDVSGDSSRHLPSQDAFIPTDLVTGRAVAVIWPATNAHILHIPDAYDDVPAGKKPPDKGIINTLAPR